MMAISTRTILAAAVALAAACHGAELPSCENDVAVNCLGDGADMSAEGIDACLEGLTSGTTRSAPCDALLALKKGCHADITGSGVCAADHAQGDTVPCLLQRTKPELLSEACRAVLPVEEQGTGIRDTFWKAGKRVLEDDEVDQLSEEDEETYTRWLKRKKKSKGSAKNNDRAYAVQKMRRDKAGNKIVKEIHDAVKAALDAKKTEKVAKNTGKRMVGKLTKAAQKADSEIGTFTKDEINDIIKEAFKGTRKKKNKDEL